MPLIALRTGRILSVGRFLPTRSLHSLPVTASLHNQQCSETCLAVKYHKDIIIWHIIIYHLRITRGPLSISEL